MTGGFCPKNGENIYRLYRHIAAMARAFSPQFYGGSDPGAAPQAGIERAVGPFQATARAKATAKANMEILAAPE